MTLFKTLSRYHHLRCSLFKNCILKADLLDELACFTYHFKGIYQARLLFIYVSIIASITFFIQATFFYLSAILKSLFGVFPSCRLEYSFDTLVS